MVLGGSLDTVNSRSPFRNVEINLHHPLFRPHEIGGNRQAAFGPRRIGEARAREMALLAERLPAAQALDWGLVNRVFPDESLQSESLALATRLAEGPVNALSRARGLFEASPCNDFEAQIAFEAKMQSQCSGAPESAEGRAAFAEKRTPDFTNIPLASREHTT